MALTDSATARVAARRARACASSTRAAVSSKRRSATGACNSLGAMQGGAVATLVDAAAEAAARAATGEPLVVTDIQLTYLALGARRTRSAPRVEVLGTAAGAVTAHVELVDDGRDVARHEHRARGRDHVAAERPGDRARRRDARHAGSAAATGRDVSRYVRVEMREVDAHRRRPAGRRARAGLAHHLRGPGGGVRAGALLTMLDNVGGLCGGLAALPDGWVVSTNLSARTVRARRTSGPFRIDARVLRQGRASVVTAVEIRDEGAGDALVVDGVLTSAILVPENGPPQWDRPLVLDPGEPPDRARAADPRVARRAAGRRRRRSRCHSRDDAAQPVGHPARRRASRRSSTSPPSTRPAAITTDVVLHFLAPNRVGPVRATARAIGARADGTVLRVEVRDEGADRVTALAIVTSRAPRSSGRAPRRLSRIVRSADDRARRDRRGRGAARARSTGSTSRSRASRSARTRPRNDRSARGSPRVERLTRVAAVARASSSPTRS